MAAVAYRPKSKDNLTWNKEIRAGKNKYDILPSQMVYLKICANLESTKTHIMVLDKLRVEHTKGDVEAGRLRALLVGRQIALYSTTDLLEGFRDAEIDTLIKGLTPSQAHFIQCYCRKIPNGLGVLQGPFGTGKTEIIKVLVNILKKSRGKLLAVTSKNTTQLESVVQRGMRYAIGVIDDCTAISDAEFITVKSICDTVILIGDDRQLGRTFLSTLEQNPLRRQLEYDIFIRLIDLGWPYDKLKEVMRMTIGLLDLPNTCFYGGELFEGPFTSLDHPSREVSRKTIKFFKERYPSLRDAPEDKVWPILLNVKGEELHDPTGGTSWYNPCNVAVVVTLIDATISANVAQAAQLGIATTYAAQVSTYNRILRSHGDKYRSITVGVAEFWMGRERRFMIVDLVCAGNSEGNNGFSADSRHLNVLLSRQQDALVIIGDRKCLDVPKKSAPKYKYDQATKRNRHLKGVFDWLTQKGRKVDILKQDVPQDIIDLGDHVEEVPFDDTAAGNEGV